jgi:thiol-disulfide isomerase/thioredoxin
MDNFPVNHETFMTRIVQNAGATFSSNKIFIAIGVIIFLIVGFAYYYFYLKPYMKAIYRANDGVNEDPNESSDKSGSDVEVLFFYAEWCPHCKVAKPIWEKMQEDNQNKLINGHKVLFTSVNCTNESEATSKLMDKFDVEGFPTIKMIKDGQIIEFDAKPTKENLTQFFDTVLK